MEADWFVDYRYSELHFELKKKPNFKRKMFQNI